jgi:hypothetical protein
MPDTVRHFRLLPAGLAAAQQRVRSRYVVPQLLLFVGAMLFLFFLGTRHNPGLHFVIPFAIALGLFFTYIAFVSPRRTRRNIEKTWQTYLLEIGPDYLLRTQADTPDLRLAFSQIHSIERLPGRFLRVIGASRQQVIGIPEDIEGFPEILATLSALHPISETSSDRSVKSFLITLLVLAAFLGMAASPSPQVAIPLAVLVIGAVLWFILYIQRSPNVSHRAKRQSWFYLILVGICVLKILMMLGRR